MDYHDLSVGGGRYHAHQLVFEAPIRAENHFSCGCDSGHRWLADHDRRPSLPAADCRPHYSGHWLRRGHAVDDQHHSGAVSSFENRPIDGRRIAGHYRGSGHRPDRRRRGDHSATVARDFRHRHSAGANRSMHRHEVH